MHENNVVTGLTRKWKRRRVARLDRQPIDWTLGSGGTHCIEKEMMLRDKL